MAVSPVILSRCCTYWRCASSLKRRSEAEVEMADGVINEIIAHRSNNSLAMAYALKYFAYRRDPKWRNVQVVWRDSIGEKLAKWQIIVQASQCCFEIMLLVINSEMKPAGKMVARSISAAMEIL